MSKEQYTLQDVCNAIGELENTLSPWKQTADGTNWTTADSLSSIYFEIKRVADILETMSNKK